MASSPFSYPTIHLPMRMLIGGSSGTGKTRLVKRLLENQNEIFGREFSYIRYCYTAPDDIYYELAATFHPKLEMIKDLPLDFLQNPGAYLNYGEHTLLILDDLITEASKSPAVDDFFQVNARHFNVSVILISQNIFHRGPFMRNISLNSTIIILTKNTRDPAQVSRLARQIEPEHFHSVEKCYADAMKLHPFGFFIIDLHVQTPTHLKYSTGLTLSDPKYLL